MKSSYAIAIAAVMLAAVFAGVAIVADEADVVEGTTETTTASFKVDTVTYQYDMGEDSILPTLDKVAPTADATYFQGWVLYKTENGGDTLDTTVYAAGSKAPALESYNGFKAKFVSYTVSFVNSTVEGDKWVKDPQSNIEAKLPYKLPSEVNAGQSVVLPKEAEITGLVEKIGGEDYQFIGWAIYDDVKKAIGTEIYAPGSEYIPTGNVTFAAVYNDGYTVVFDADGITTTYKSIALSNVNVSSPAKEGYTFDGWYDANGVKYEKGKYVFTSDVTFTAKFIPQNMTVTFEVGEFAQTQTVLYGSKAMAPALPEGYDAWVDATGEVFDFNTVITENITLTAREAAEPEPAPVTVTFKIETATYGPYVISDRFSIPNTDREGYAFAGWLLAGGDGTKLTNEQVSKLINETKESLVFTATYDVVEPPAPVEPPFWETTNGQVAIIVVVFLVLAFGYAVYTNMFGLKDKLFGFKIERKKKD